MTPADRIELRARICAAVVVIVAMWAMVAVVWIVWPEPDVVCIGSQTMDATGTVTTTPVECVTP